MDLLMIIQLSMSPKEKEIAKKGSQDLVKFACEGK
jgi:hypothetical protein